MSFLRSFIYLLVISSQLLAGLDAMASREMLDAGRTRMNIDLDIDLKMERGRHFCPDSATPENLPIYYFKSEIGLPNSSVFHVGGGVFYTARHVINEMKSKNLKLILFNAAGKPVTEVALVDHGGGSGKRDWAKLKSRTAFQSPSLLMTTREVIPSRVFAIGYPSVCREVSNATYLSSVSGKPVLDAWLTKQAKSWIGASAQAVTMPWFEHGFSGAPALVRNSRTGEYLAVGIWTSANFYVTEKFASQRAFYIPFSEINRQIQSR